MHQWNGRLTGKHNYVIDQAALCELATSAARPETESVICDIYP